MVCCATPLASLFASLLENLALRGRVASVAIAAIVVRRAIIHSDSSSSRRYKGCHEIHP